MSKQDLVKATDASVSKPPLSDKYVQLAPRIVDTASEYLEQCGNTDDVPCLVGFSIYCGVYKDTLCNWYNRAVEGDDRYMPALGAYKKVREAAERYLVKDTVTRKNAMSLALLKMNHGYMEEESRQKIDQAERGVASGTTIVINTGVPLPSSIPIELPTTNTYDSTYDSTDEDTYDDE